MIHPIGRRLGFPSRVWLAMIVTIKSILLLFTWSFSLSTTWFNSFSILTLLRSFFPWQRKEMYLLPTNRHLKGIFWIFLMQTLTRHPFGSFSFAKLSILNSNWILIELLMCDLPFGVRFFLLSRSAISLRSVLTFQCCDTSLFSFGLCVFFLLLSFAFFFCVWYFFEWLTSTQSHLIFCTFFALECICWR